MKIRCVVCKKDLGDCNSCKKYCDYCREDVNRLGRQKYFALNYKKVKKDHKKYWKKRGSRVYRERYLKRRFGFVPKLYMHNKEISTGGCVLRRDKLIVRYRKNFKCMYLYDILPK